MAADQARAALMRLRDKLRAEGLRTIGIEDQWNTGYRAACQQWCDWIDRELAALPADEAAVCEFCDGPLGDKSDHGLGECCPICPTCDGTGSADEAAGASAGLVARIKPPTRMDPPVIEAFDMTPEQPDERDKTIAELLQMHNDTERVLDEFGLLHDVKAALPDQVRAVCKEVVELREKVADLHKQIDGMAEDYQTCAKACAAEEERAEKAELEVVELRERATKRETLIDAMRSVLRDTAKAAGCSVTDATTDEFLAYLPGEVALLASNSDWEKAYGALLIAKEREEKRADAAEAALASARKEGLRELRETCVSQRERWERIGDWARVHEIEWFMRSIDRLLAADTAPSKPEPDHPQYDADATLRDFVRINDGKDFSDMRDEALAELCRRALGVTGTVGKEAGDGEAMGTPCAGGGS